MAKKAQKSKKTTAKRRTKTARSWGKLRRQLGKIARPILSIWLWVWRWVHATWTRKIVAVFLIVAAVATLGMYAVAQWYIYQKRHEPFQIGATYISDYARFYGLDAEETFLALVDDLGFERLRLVSYWNKHEPEPGVYDFSDLDWQFELAEEYDVEVTLTLGLRQPRWPECHMPDWAAELPKEEWYQALEEYIAVTIDRYKDSPVLVDYQLENEFLLEVFGICPDHNRQRLIDQFELVKELDPDRPVVVSRSNNATPSWPIGEPRADIIGAAVYKRVWDKTVTNRYFEYPLPAWYYAFLAGGAKLTTGRDSILHELQTEPWLPDGYDMRTASTDELYQTMNPEMLRERLQYGRDTGMKLIDVWGVEWWYHRKIKSGDDGLWEAARAELEYTRQLNEKILRQAGSE